MHARTLLQSALQENLRAVSCRVTAAERADLDELTALSDRIAPINSSDRDPWHGNAADRPATPAQDDELRLAAQGVMDLMTRSPFYAASLHAPAVQRLKRALGARP